MKFGICFRRVLIKKLQKPNRKALCVAFLFQLIVVILLETDLCHCNNSLAGFL